MKPLFSLTESQFRQILQEVVSQALQPKEERPDLITLSEACDMLDLAKPTIYSLCSKKQIPYYKKNGRLYFSRLRLNAWIRSGRELSYSEEADLDTIKMIKKLKK